MSRVALHFSVIHTIFIRFDLLFCWCSLNVSIQSDVVLALSYNIRCVPLYQYSLYLAHTCGYADFEGDGF